MWKYKDTRGVLWEMTTRSATNGSRIMVDEGGQEEPFSVVTTNYGFAPSKHSRTSGPYLVAVEVDDK